MNLIKAMNNATSQIYGNEYQISSRHSIILRTLIAFSLIIAFNLASMLGGMYLAESIRGDAEAINKAGRMRMQSVRLALIMNTEPDEEISALEQNSQSTIANYISEFESTIH